MEFDLFNPDRKAVEVPLPPSSAGICGGSLFVSSAPPSGSIPAMADSAAAGAVLTPSSTGFWAGGFCGGGFCPAERNCSPATIHTRIKQRRILITTTTEPPAYRQLAGGCFAPDPCL